MLAFTREQLVEHLQELSNIVDDYASGPSYFERVRSWLENVEKSLQRVRSPLSSSVASERAKLLAAADGLRETELSASTMSPRKAVRAASALVLGRTETLLRARVSEIDEKFDTARDKIAQLLALATSKEPIPLPPTDPRETWLRGVWTRLGMHSETRSMWVYLNSTLNAYDRMHLLDDVLSNLLSAEPGFVGNTGASGDGTGDGGTPDDWGGKLLPGKDKGPGGGLLNKPAQVEGGAESGTQVESETQSSSTELDSEGIEAHKDVEEARKPRRKKRAGTRTRRAAPEGSNRVS